MASRTGAAAPALAHGEPSNLLSTVLVVEEKKDPEPILCRLCKGTGLLAATTGDDDVPCVFCKGVGLCNAEDIDEWTFADLDEPLGPGAIGVVSPRWSYVPPNAEWHTWVEEGRGYMWAELRRCV